MLTFYLVLKNLVLWTRPENFGFALEFYFKKYKIQAPNYK